MCCDQGFTPPPSDTVTPGNGVGHTGQTTEYVNGADIAMPVPHLRGCILLLAASVQAAGIGDSLAVGFHSALLQLLD